MNGLGYVAIQSWHIAVLESRGGQFQTRCGKWTRSDLVHDLPLNGKSCETCLRLVRKDEERSA